MPFININVHRRRPNPFLILLDQLLIVSCDDIITLEATVQKPGIYLWEQLSGNTVVWLTPLNEVSATFEQTLVRDDKVFRFWVNKGTLSEAHADILVTAVPRDYIPQMLDTAFNRRGYAADEVAVSLMVPGLSPEGTVTVNNILRGIFFPTPTTLDPIKGYKVYDVTGGITETLLAQFLPPARSYFDVPPLKNFRIDTTVETNGLLHDARGEVASFYPPAGWVDMDTFDRGSMHALPSSFTLDVMRFVYEVISITPGVTPGYDVDNAYVVMQSTGQLDNTYTRYAFTLVVLPTIDEDISAHMLDNTFSTTVTRLNLGIGGIG